MACHVTYTRRMPCHVTYTRRILVDVYKTMYTRRFVYKTRADAYEMRINNIYIDARETREGLQHVCTRA